MKRTIIVGDVHSCSDELNNLVDKLALTSDDEVYFVGDLIEKGYNVKGTLDLVMLIPNVKSVIGNHENKYLRFLEHERRCKLSGKKNPMTSVSDHDREQYKQITDEQSNWIKSLPLIHKIEQFNTVIVHGGFLPFLGIDYQVKNRSREIIRMRFIDNDSGTFVGLLNGPEQPPNTVLWSEVYDGPMNVVYGHISHTLDKPRVDRRSDGIECISVDTGCVTGGRLTSYILETKEFVQVNAKKQYAKFWNID